MNRLKEVQDLIDKADDAYYTHGKSVMEDSRYDKLKLELQTLNPTDARLTRVGSRIKDNILQKRNHTVPMGSQGKALNEGEWNDWISNNLVKAGVSADIELHASLKMDGGSFSLEYKDGRLVCAISRGDGLVGEDITANAINFKGIPPMVTIGGKLFNGFVRGEVILLEDDWDKVDPNKDSNPRNLAVGIARRKDGTQSELLSFYAFRVFDSDGYPLGNTESGMLIILSSVGFNVPPGAVGDSKQIWSWYICVQADRAKYPFWIDGVVVKVNDIEKQLALGESSNCPKGQVAIKFEAEGATTVLRAVTLQVGHTGAIVPVANFDPVRIGGTTVLNATLCNWENIQTLGIAIGDTISVIKAGDIIPRIMEVVSQGKNRQEIPAPKRCPICNGKAEHKDNLSGEESALIYCINSLCPAVVSGKIEKYLKSLDIQTGGDSLIKALIDDMGVKVPSDLYLLHKNKSKLANLILSGKVRFGEKRAQKFLDEIDAKKTLTISEFLGSLGIFGLGKRRVVLIQKAVPGEFETLDDWFSDKLLTKAVEGGVKNMAKRIWKDINDNKKYIESFIVNGVTIVKPQPQVKLKDGAFVICITGALSKPKDFFRTLIESSGNGYADSFGKSVTHLVAADPTSGSAKLEKAKKSGTKVIDESELMKLVGNVVIPSTPKPAVKQSVSDNWFAD